MLKVRLEKEFITAERPSFSLDVDFSVESRIAVLFGPSGSGKTTILRLIAGMLTPASGKIEVGGAVYFDSAAGVNLPIQKRRVGFVFQDYLLFPHLTAAENVAYGIAAGHSSWREKKFSERLDSRWEGIGSTRQLDRTSMCIRSLLPSEAQQYL